MTREIVRPAWAWVCDGCGRVDGAFLARRQEDLPDFDTMRRRGWHIYGPHEPVVDLCPNCVAKEATDG